MTAQAVAPLARVALARSPVRMLVPALIALVVGGAGLGLGAVIGGTPGIALLVGGSIVLAFGLWLAARVLSLRLLIEPGYLHLRGLGTDRRFKLARGQLARVPTAGPRRVSLAVRPGSLGLAVGKAKLPSGEPVHVIRLGATPSVILVPTEQGRVALAVASEAAFVDALVAAARKRAEQPAAVAPVEAAVSAAEPTPAAPAASVVSTAVAPAAGLPSRASVADMPVPPPTAALATGSAVAVRPTPTPATPLPFPAEPEPPRARPLTGIERMWLEDRLARERRAALAGARDEQAAASFTASVAALTPAGARVVPTVPSPAPAEEASATSTAARAAAAALTTAPAVAATPALVAASAAAAAPGASATALPRVIPRRRPVRSMARRITRPGVPPVVILVATPLVGALVSWLLAVVLGNSPGASGMDPIAAALLLCGPVAALAVYLAYSRWPRLAGLSSVSAILALVLVARALIGSA